MIKDSGKRRIFNTGAKRDIEEGKGRCDLMPLLEVAGIIQDDVVQFIGLYKTTGNITHLVKAITVFTEKNYSDKITMILEVSKHYEQGALKYGEGNWEKGIPLHSYIDSALRHYFKFKRGDKDEPHDRAFVWNLLCAMWTIHNKPECIDIQGGSSGNAN